MYDALLDEFEDEATRTRVDESTFVEPVAEDDDNEDDDWYYTLFDHVPDGMLSGDSTPTYMRLPRADVEAIHDRHHDGHAVQGGLRRDHRIVEAGALDPDRSQIARLEHHRRMAGQDQVEPRSRAVRDLPGGTPCPRSASSPESAR